MSIENNLNLIKKKPKSSAERARAYRARKKLLNAAIAHEDKCKLLLTSGIIVRIENGSETCLGNNENKDYRPWFKPEPVFKNRPKTAAERSRKYRERKKVLKATAVQHVIRELSTHLENTDISIKDDVDKCEYISSLLKNNKEPLSNNDTKLVNDVLAWFKINAKLEKPKKLLRIEDERIEQI